MFLKIRTKEGSANPVFLVQAIRNTSSAIVPSVIREIEIWRVAVLTINRYAALPAALRAGGDRGGGLAPDHPDRNGRVAVAPAGCRAAGDLIRGRSAAAATGGRQHRLRVDPRDGGR